MVIRTGCRCLDHTGEYYQTPPPVNKQTVDFWGLVC